MRYSLLLAAAALIFILPGGLQAKAKKADAPKEAISTEYNTLSAKVVKIDKATHTLTLLNDLNERHQIQVDPNQVKNFAQIKVGDMVVVRQTQSLALTLTKHQKGQKPGAGAAIATETASPGQKPGAEQAKVVRISAEILKIDAKKNSVKLKGPEGNTFWVKAKDPSRISGLQKGDMVAATYTKAIAVSVEAAPSK